MMKKMFKKSIAMLIAVLMVVSTMPFTALTAFAADSVSLDTAKSQLNNFSYSGNNEWDYGSFSGDNQSNWATGTNYTTYMKNVLYGVKSSTYEVGNGSYVNNIQSWIKYPQLVFLYDGITNLDAPVLLQITSNNLSTAGRQIQRANVETTDLAMVRSRWNGTDQSDNWVWLYSQEIQTDQKGTGTTSDQTSWISSWNYRDKYYRHANMIRFTGSMSSTEYTQSIYPEIKAYVSGNNVLTNSGKMPYYYINYKVVLDKIAQAKTDINTVKDEYSEETKSAYAKALSELVSFDPSTLSFSASTLDSDVAAAGNKIKTLIDNYDNAYKNLSINYTFKRANGETKVIPAKNYDYALSTAGIVFQPSQSTEKAYKTEDKHAWKTYAWPTSVEDGTTEITEIETEHTEDCSYPNVPEYVDETNHMYICSVCSHEKFEKHTYDDNNKCTKCDYVSIDLSTYNAAVAEADSIIANADGKYTADSVAEYKKVVDAAKAKTYTTQEEVDAIVSEIQSAKTLLAKARVTVKFVINNDDTDTATTVSEDTYDWGENVSLDTESNYVSKWTISVNGVTSNMASTASAIDHIATEDATITAYVSNDESDAVKYSKVTFIGRNNQVVAIKYVESGTTYETKNVQVPAVPFYKASDWDKATVDADGSDIIVRATYVPEDVAENKCGIHFNGDTKYYNYDSYVYLFNADKSKKYAMYADEAGTQLITYFDGVDFYAPRRDNLYIKEVTDTSAMTATIGFTGSYQQDLKSSFNVKFWLPEGATLVETGVDLKATFPNGTVKTAHDRCTKYNQRNEYTYSAKFGTGKKSIEFTPYLTYMQNGTKTTVYGNPQTVEFN